MYKKTACLLTVLSGVCMYADSRLDLTITLMGETTVTSVVLKNKESFEILGQDNLVCQAVLLPGETGPILSIEVRQLNEQGTYDMLFEPLLFLVWDEESVLTCINESDELVLSLTVTASQV